jgi:hypothetical protein
MHAVNYCVETDYGVVNATPTGIVYPVRYTGFTGGLSRDTFESMEIRADRISAGTRLGAKNVQWEIATELSYGSLDTLLQAVTMGTWNTNVLETGTTRRSYTLERYFADLTTGNKFYRLLGSEFNSLKLSVTTGGIITATFGGISQDEATAAATIATVAAADTTEPFDAFQGALTNEDGALATVTDFQIELTNGLEPFFVVGTPLTMLPSVGRSKISGTLTCRFSDADYFDKFVSEDKDTLTLTLTDAATNELEIVLPNVTYTGGARDVSGDGPVKIVMPFRADYDSGAASNITFTRTAAV